jgi:hypothetical protein
MISNYIIILKEYEIIRNYKKLFIHFQVQDLMKVQILLY